MKIILNGFGQMGRMINSISQNYKVEVIGKVDPNIESCSKILTKEILQQADCVIDFALPDRLVETIQFCLQNKTPVVIGTTGWLNHIEDIKHLTQQYSTPVIWGSNFSVGMNLFFKIADQTSQVMSKIKDYDPYGIEYHHKKKADSPSGTAKTLCRKVLSHYPEKVSQFDRINRVKSVDEMHFASVRAGAFPGTHKIGFDSNFDTINIEHIARSREGFAVGSILAAKWIIDKSGFFEFCEVFDDILGEIDD
jgi:4-hydroxy-tetrahydrodipicolinate reductase